MSTADPRYAGGDPTGLVGPGAHPLTTAQQRLHSLAGNEEVSTAESVGGSPGGEDLSRVRSGIGGPDHGGQRADVVDLDPSQEAHPVQPFRSGRTRTRLSVGPEGLTVVHAVEDVLDVALGRQHQGGGALTGAQVEQVLGGQGVQPAQPLGSVDPEHVAVGEVDESGAALDGPLLAHGIAVVPGHPGVGSLIGYDRGFHIRFSVETRPFLP